MSNDHLGEAINRILYDVIPSPSLRGKIVREILDIPTAPAAPLGVEEAKNEFRLWLDQVIWHRPLQHLPLSVSESCANKAAAIFSRVSPAASECVECAKIKAAYDELLLAYVRVFDDKPDADGNYEHIMYCNFDRRVSVTEKRCNCPISKKFAKLRESQQPPAVEVLVGWLDAGEVGG